MLFKSKIYQKDGVIDATQLYSDIEDAVEKDKKELNVEKLYRGHPLQHILNSTSGQYIAPTSMKSFQQCPAGYLFNKTKTEITGSATSIGRSFHTIMEEFYNLEKELRTKEEIYKITKRIIEEDKQFSSESSILKYVEGYLESNDYITGKPMDHTKLECANEVFIKPTINPLGVNLNIPIYLKIDRIDIRNEGIFVIDYKTGMGDPNPYLLGENGYLPQMIFYKWGVEAEYGEKVNKAYLCLPGSDSLNCRYTEMNVSSLVQQSKVVEEVFHHLESAREIRESLQFPERIMRYCNSCQMKHMCSTYIKYKGLDESEILEEIPVNIEYELEFPE